jgi:hypothetical protein
MLSHYAVVCSPSIHQQGKLRLVPHAVPDEKLQRPALGQAFRSKAPKASSLLLSDAPGGHCAAS